MHTYIYTSELNYVYMFAFVLFSRGRRAEACRCQLWSTADIVSCVKQENVCRAKQQTQGVTAVSDS